MPGSSDLMWWLDAVIDSGKVDLMVLPDRPHEILRMDLYVQGAVRRYFEEHLKPDA